MKTLLSTLRFAAALLTLSIAAPAQSDPAGTVQANCYPIQNSLKCRLLFENPQGKAVTVIIRDAKGQKQYEETFYGLTKFNRPYNLAPLGDGTYTFEVKQGKTHWARDLTVSTTQERVLALKETDTRANRVARATALARIPQP